MSWATDQFTHSCSFVLGDLSKSLTVAQLIWAKWAISEWAKSQPCFNLPWGILFSEFSYLLFFLFQNMFLLLKFLKNIYFFIFNYDGKHIFKCQFWWLLWGKKVYINLQNWTYFKSPRSWWSSLLISPLKWLTLQGALYFIWNVTDNKVWHSLRYVHKQDYITIMWWLSICLPPLPQEYNSPHPMLSKRINSIGLLTDII